MLGRLRDYGVVALAFVFVVIAWRSSLGPGEVRSANAHADVRQTSVQDGTTHGESQPLVALPPDAVVELASTPQLAEDNAPAGRAAAGRAAVAFDSERSVLVSSRIDHAAGGAAAAAIPVAANDGQVRLVSFVPEPQESASASRGRAERDEQYWEHKESEEGEEHDEDAPPNSVAQGNARSQPDLETMMKTPEGSGAVEQTTMGEKPAPEIVASVDGLGMGFVGPQGRSRGGNPSDNSIAVGPDHIVVTVNSQMAVLTKKGRKYNETGKVLYGPVNTSNVFRDCGNCERNNGDAVVRYDHLADRWLIVMPLFSRSPARPEGDPEPAKSGEPPHASRPGREGQPGPAVALFQPPALTPEELAEQEAARGRGAARRGRGQGGGRGRGQAGPRGSYGMCYAISTTSDPLGSYYRYEFVRALFPDYPRPAIWPDGYYVPTSTGDNVIEKHACVVEREAMLRGQPAREQCAIIGDVNFLNNADLDGFELPPPGAPNIMMAAGGTQLNEDLDDDGIYVWKMSVNWDDPAMTKVEGPEKIEVAPYNYLCGGQLTRCVPQQGSDTRLDAQGDKIMARLVYRRIGDQESIVGVHSVNTTAGGGGVRWYEFRIEDPNGQRSVKLHQQGTYAPGGDYRWMASPAIDKFGNIGIGYSYGGADKFPGQRFAGRQPNDPLGRLTLKEAVLIEGQAAQEGATRWQDYVQTAVDPSDDCTIWYVGDYVKEGQTRYSSRIGAFRLPGCGD